MPTRTNHLHHHPPSAATAPVMPGIAAGLRDEPDAAPVLDSRDYSRLKALAHHRLGLEDPVGRMLAEKLGACHVLPSEAVPASVAVLGARLILALPGRGVESRVLAMPEEHASGGWTLPVSVPLGAALLGAAAGHRMEVVERDGRRRTVHLLAVDRASGLPRRTRPAPGREGTWA